MGKAAQAGIGWVGVRNGNHAGPAALYVRPQTERGMIGLAAAVGSANHVPPFGGSDLLLGTNPIAIAAPAGRHEPFVLDMATTVAAVGKIRTLAQRGESMPEGWMVARDGKPLTDPKRQSEGLMLPIGGPKGYGLAMALGLLAGSLNGAAFGMGDLCVAPFVNGSLGFGNGPKPGTRLARWLARVNERPSVAAAAGAARAAAAEAATSLGAVAEQIASGRFKREYRDHRLEWMIRSGGLDVVLEGLAKENIRFVEFRGA